MVCQVHVVSAPCRYFRKLGDVDLRARLPTTTRVPDMGPGRGGTMKPSSFSSYLYEFATVLAAVIYEYYCTSTTR